jgi:cytochrome P450
MTTKQAKQVQKYWCGIPVAFTIWQSLTVFRLMLKNPSIFFTRIAGYGPMGVFWLGPQPVVCITDPVAAKHIIIAKNGVGLARKFMGVFELYFGQGVFSWEGEVWERARALIDPNMTPDKLDAKKEVIHKAILELVDRLIRDSDLPGGADVFDAASDTALKASCSGALGIELTNDQLKKLRQLLEKTITCMFRRMNSPVRALFGGLSRKDKVVVQELQEFVRKIITDFERAYKEGPHQAPGVLGALMREYWTRRMSEEMVRSNFLQLLAAAYETTSGALTRLIHCLAVYPELWSRPEMRAEALGWDEEALSHTTLQRLPYARSAVREVLRRFPPLVNMIREVKNSEEADDLSVVLGDGSRYTIPQGAYLVVPASILHHNPNLWGNDAEEFKPWRHVERSHRPPGLSYCPFGAGGRMCPGQHLAQRMLIECFMALLARTTRVEIMSPLPREVSQLTSRLEGLKVRVVVR